MRKTLAVLAAVALCLTFAPAQANIVVGGTSTGDSGNGFYGDHTYYNADIGVGWVRNSQTSYSGSYLNGYVRTAGLADFQNYNTCVQVVLDWDTPQGAPHGHYDSRMVRNCDPNSIEYLDGSDGMTEPNPLCGGGIGPGGGPIGCDMPMGRVQIARWVPALNTLIDSSKECWYRESGHTVADCTSWEPACPVGAWACHGWIRQRDGDLVERDGGSPVSPSSKRR